MSFKKNTLLLEEFNLNSGEFKGIIPFPKESKFSSGEVAYGIIFHYPVFTVQDDSLYLCFKNEPKIYVYSLEDLTNPKSVIPIPLENFIEEIATNEKIGNEFNLIDAFKGSINSLEVTQTGQFLLNYLAGITEEEFKQAEQNSGGDMSKIWDEGSKFNSGGTILFDGKSVSPFIRKPSDLNNLEKFISKDEIWFSPNTSLVEKDYTVFYKARIRPSQEE